MSTDIQEIRVPGARKKVEVQGAQGIFLKVLIGGEVTKPLKGSWQIPGKGGLIRMRLKGYVPGFQKLVVDDEVVFDAAGPAGWPERIALFVPALLMLVQPVVGLVAALFLVFANVYLVRNPRIPRVLRLLTPVIQTVLLGYVIYMFVRTVNAEAAAAALGALE